MLKLKIETTYNDCCCDVRTSDITGFSTNGGTDGGFIPEGGTLLTNQDYHLSDGAFVKAVFKLDYERFCINMVNNVDKQIPYIIPTNQVKAVYTDNVKGLNENVNSDGFIYISTYFIISKAFYDARKNEVGRFDNTRPIVYLNEDDGKFYFILDDYQETIPNITKLINTIRNHSDLQGVVKSEESFFNICNVKKCFKKTVEKNLDNILGYDKNKKRARCITGKNCPEDDDLNLDLLEKVIMSLEYLVECEEYLDADKLLGIINNCGGICKDYNNDCNCK